MILKLNKDFLLNFTILSNDDNKLQENSLKTIQSNDLLHYFQGRSSRRMIFARYYGDYEKSGIINTTKNIFSAQTTKIDPGEKIFWF